MEQELLTFPAKVIANVKKWIVYWKITIANYYFKNFLQTRVCCIPIKLDVNAKSQDLTVIVHEELQ